MLPGISVVRPADLSTVQMSVRRFLKHFFESEKICSVEIMLVRKLKEGTGIG